jgi:polysaccharide deacetylase family protein (PEP-CTERM system associated)
MIVVPDRRHILTVLLEDYFHVGAFHKIIHDEKWYRFETRFEQNTLNTLDLLDRFNIKATFFVLGWIADRQPELIKEIIGRGHEIASRGYVHRSVRDMTRAEFRDDLRRAKYALECATGKEILGYRAARRWIDPDDLWALDFLTEEGYAYDSSLVPSPKAVRLDPAKRFAHQYEHNGKSLWEFPVSTFQLGPSLMPIGGGNYFRQFPHTLIKNAVDHWHRTYTAPFVMYFHVWELDPVQPRIAGASALMKLRHYRNLHKMPWILEDYFTKYKFGGVADYLGLPTATNGSLPAAGTVRETIVVSNQLPSTQAAVNNGNRKSNSRVPISIVVPCFNEELVLSYLSNTLRSVESHLSQQHSVNFIFVDDGSGDGTFDGLRRLFGDKHNCIFIRHSRNKGVAAAILTGVKAAETEIVCSIDCDCTYDPHELLNMIPLLKDEVDLVTASPYHPNGKVRNVPGWRLALSKTASFLYRRVLKQKLYTYTSCFRVYRKSMTRELSLSESGFLGIAEMLGRLDLRGAKVVEYPTVLEVRLFGRSKMKTIRTIGGHLRLLARLLATRIRGGVVISGASKDVRLAKQQ